MRQQNHRVDRQHIKRLWRISIYHTPADTIAFTHCDLKLIIVFCDFVRSFHKMQLKPKLLIGYTELTF